MSANFNELLSAVVKQTSDFKKYFLNTVHESAEREFSRIPANIAKINKQLAEIEEKSREISKSYINSHGGIISMKLFNEAMPAQRSLWKERDKCKTTICKLARQLAMGKDKYILNALDDANKAFDEKVYSLASRLDKKSFDPNNISFSNVCDDPKMFDVYIQSESKRVHARSILAAEYSECMIPHFRFIITNAR